jgi:hypothetical protein
VLSFEDRKLTVIPRLLYREVEVIRHASEKAKEYDTSLRIELSLS